MTTRILACWALCGALASADDKPKDETAKPKTAAEAVEAMTKAKSARPRSRAEVPGMLTKMIVASDAVLGFKDASEAQKEQALATKAMALNVMTNYKPEAAKELLAFADMVEKEYPKSATVKTLDFARFRVTFLSDEVEKLDPAALTAFHGLMKKYPNDRALPSLYGMMAGVVETTEGAVAARKLVEEGLKLFPNDKQLPNTLKGLKLIGQPIEIVGPTLEGSEYNLANMKGKVVLVDFWATWCGPCIQELPHVKAAYKKYHDKGFEIVGVSLDKQREPLEKFIKKEDMTWPQIIFSKEEEMWWKNPVAVKHEIRSIPATYLIGRDGKIAARNLRGKKLERAVAKEIAKSSNLAN